MVRVRSSRRVPGLRPSDYDHEIGLVDNDEAGAEAAATAASRSSDDVARRASSASQLASLAEETEHEEQEPLTDAQTGSTSAEPQESNGIEPTLVEEEQHERDRNLPREELQHEATPTPDAFNEARHRIMPKRPREKRETAIDILYENERGGFLCGAALFSSKALGGLDPPAWTNAYHKTSPTSIHTAQVPDPTWEWVWPDWRVNHQEGMDEGGWEYSFAFGKTFSWHGASWWNSFVRRRAWIRKRAKKNLEAMSSDPQLLNADYFVVRPASYRSRDSNGSSLASSRAPSKYSMAEVSTSEVDEPLPDIEDIGTLLRTLRLARIDREKREAIENYIEHGTDLEALQGEMHEIMALFVFQASRKQLLGHLMREHEHAVEQLARKETKNKTELTRRKEALDAAIMHAHEEVRKLAYWSDMKQMAESGDLRNSLDSEQGWYDADTYRGLDQSGPSAPNRGKLPGPKGKGPAS
ncbi:meiotically up-regulated 65 protein [Purpureocillium lavendulum]|uniref:Meiotically up-regulated 65 protein n=1 Tax=Purpureocillium lavendulum TaxID=1247861 RepID=A0AB34FMD4_9HYPO|nr:meiotically up-regulated 65 protein [Purpureocillium lavendulum]